jgi:NAD(P)-dependent dehydrogenase (short-subunit alcohol dehydrogenase family)
MITRCVALEVEGRPIRIAALSPGPFESRMQRAIREASLEDFPSRQKFIDLYEQGLLAHPDSVARKILDIAFSRWPSLSGVVADLRSEDFQRLCLEQGIDIRGA